MNKITPVEKNGKLSIKGNHIYNTHGKLVQLKGMSLFWSQWMDAYWRDPFLSSFIHSWNLPILRAPLGIENGGYLENPEREISRMHTVIRTAIKNGIYIIVDWHDHHAPEHSREACKFFEEIASTYAEYPNIIYEIFNEPLHVSWSGYVKPYAESIISTIRKYDKDNIIVTGTPNWDQDVDLAAQDPLKGDNLAYSLHFYATSHKSDIREKARAALERDIALFVTEWGSCHANGDGIIDYGETEKWLRFTDEHSLSWCHWSISNKHETSAIFTREPDSTNKTFEPCLTESGRFIKSILFNLKNGPAQQ